jgi:hypothetical protein
VVEALSAKFKEMTFSKGTTVQEIERRLQTECNATHNEVVGWLQAYADEIKDDKLVRTVKADVKVNIQPAPPAKPELVKPNVAPTVATGGNRPGQADQSFIDKQIQNLLTTKIDVKQELGPVAVGVQNSVLATSDDPAQKAFLAANPNGRIIRQSITLSGDTGNVDLFGSLKAKLNGSQQVTIEVPVAGATKEEIEKRLKPIYGLIKSATGKFWEEAGRADIAAGTRIASTVGLGGDLAGSIDELQLSGKRSAQVSVDTRWTNPKNPDEVSVTVDTLGVREKGLKAQLGIVGGQDTETASDHWTHTYSGLRLGSPEHKSALEKTLTWKNRLVPGAVNTAPLDALKLGNHSGALTRTNTVGGNVAAPVGGYGTVSGGLSHRGEELLKIDNVPDHGPNGTPIDWQAETARRVKAIQADEPAGLIPGVAGMAVGKVVTGDTAASWGVSLRQTADILPGAVGVGAVASFASSVSETDLVGTRVEYDAKNPNMAHVFLWRFDAEKMVNTVALEAGLTLDTKMKADVSNALRDHVLNGVGLESYADKLGGAAFSTLKSVTEKLKARVAYSRGTDESSFSSLYFKDFDLTQPEHKAAFEELIRDRNVTRAVKDGHLKETVDRNQNKTTSQFDASFAGFNLFSLNTGDLQTIETRTFGLGTKEQKIVRLFDSDIDWNKNGLTENRKFEADEILVNTKSPVTGQLGKPETLMRFRLRTEDKVYRDRERRIDESVAPAGNLEIKTNLPQVGSWKGEVDVSGVITSEGNRKILETKPHEAERIAIATASRMMGMTSPPDDVAMTMRLGRMGPAAAAHAVKALRAQRGLVQSEMSVFQPDVEAKMKEARAKVRQAAPALQQVDDAALDSLLRSAAAVVIREDYKGLARIISRTEEEEQRINRLVGNYRDVTKYLQKDGKDRSVVDDLWILEHGRSVRGVFEKMNNARSTLKRGKSLDDKQMRTLVFGVFRKAALEHRPGLWALSDTKDRDNYAFWMTLMNAAGQGNSLAKVEIKSGGGVVFQAQTPGADPAVMGQLMGTTGSSIMDKTAPVHQ